MQKSLSIIKNNQLNRERLLWYCHFIRLVNRNNPKLLHIYIYMHVFSYTLLDVPHWNMRHWVIIIFGKHDDVIKLKHFPRYWPFVRGIHRSPVNSPHKGQWRWALVFSLICAWINGWVNNREAGDLKRHRAHYDVTVMKDLWSVRQQASTWLVANDDLLSNERMETNLNEIRVKYETFLSIKCTWKCRLWNVYR